MQRGGHKNSRPAPLDALVRKRLRSAPVRSPYVGAICSSLSVRCANLSRGESMRAWSSGPRSALQLARKVESIVAVVLRVRAIAFHCSKPRSSEASGSASRALGESPSWGAGSRARSAGMLAPGALGWHDPLRHGRPPPPISPGGRLPLPCDVVHHLCGLLRVGLLPR